MKPDSDKSGADASAASDGVPRAIVHSAQAKDADASRENLQPGGRLRTKLWWLTGICGVLALGLVVSSLRSQGTLIQISFTQGHGLKAGDTLRYRGIDVGSVVAIEVRKDLSGVEVQIMLEPGSEVLATQGSKFWIERPQLQLGQLRGLETVVGAKYVGVLPGDLDATRQLEFTGVENPIGLIDGQTSEIRILFASGGGLSPGCSVQYRGIAVGEVTQVALTDVADGVWVSVRLLDSARELARGGTQFWIERPRLDLTEVRGLETLLGGHYLAMQPTSSKGQLQNEFVGLDSPPPLSRSDGSLEIQLDAPRRLGLMRGAPVAYRGVEVGRVTNVGMSSDGASVKVGVTIEPGYSELVRTNSKWWAASGFEFEAGLKGITLSMESLTAWLRGGIAFATPQSPGQSVVTGHRFMLEPEPLAEWLEWQPRIVVGGSSDVTRGLKLPEPVRVVASWRQSLLGLYRRRTIQCWGIAMDDGFLRVPSRFVRDLRRSEGEVLMELAGQSFVVDGDQGMVSDLIAMIKLPQEISVPLWDAQQVNNVFTQDSLYLVVNPELSEPLVLDATRVSVEKGIGLKIAPGIPISDELAGSPVVLSQNGRMFGLLVESSEGWLIAKLP